MIKRTFLLTLSLFSVLSIFAENVTVNLTDSESGFSLYRGDKKLVELKHLSFDFTKPDSIALLSRTDQQINLLMYFSWINPDGTENLTQQVDTLAISIESDYIRVMAAPKWAKHTQLVLEDLGGAYYGLQQTLYPANKKTPNLRNATIDVEVNVESYRYHENYASVYSAFYFNSKGYASFYDTFAAGRYQLAQNGNTILTHYTGKLDWYLFTGDYKTIYKSYYAIIGAPKYVPDWACGPIIWRDENTGSQQILDDVDKFSQLKIPFTSIFVDRPYSNGTHGWSKMDFSSEFANPERWIAELNEHCNVEFMTWITSATFGDDEFPGLLDGHFGYLDLTNREAVEEFELRLTNQQYQYGVKGHKLDRGDEHFPAAEAWADGTDLYQRKNKYPYLYARITDSLLNKSWGLDNVNFARAAFHRSQPYLTAVWGGDVRTSWDGLASNIANAMRCSFMGFPNWGSDVGGYLGEGFITEELYARWLQFGVWTGFYEVKLDGAGGAGLERTPWQYSEEFRKLYADIFSERMDLIPYIYSTLNGSDENGPLMKPMAMVFPEDKRFMDCWDQYMFGEAFLVAPLYSAGSKRKVVLPEGEWYDYYTGDKYIGTTTVDVEKGMNEYPVFIKAGSIYAKGKTVSGNSKLWDNKQSYINIYFVPGEGCEFTFIDATTQLQYVISAKKVSNKAYEIAIPENTLIKDLYVISDMRLVRAEQNGNKRKIKMVKHSGEFLISKVAGAKMTLVFE